MISYQEMEEIKKHILNDPAFLEMQLQLSLLSDNPLSPDFLKEDFYGYLDNELNKRLSDDFTFEALKKLYWPKLITTIQNMKKSFDSLERSSVRKKDFDKLFSLYKGLEKRVKELTNEVEKMASKKDLEDLEARMTNKMASKKDLENLEIRIKKIEDNMLTKDDLKGEIGEELVRRIIVGLRKVEKNK